MSLNAFKLCFNICSTFLLLSRMLNEVEAVSPPLSTLLGMRLRTKRFLKPRLQQSRSQRLRSFWSAPRKQDLWANQCQNPAIRNLIGCCILPEVSLNRRFQRQEIWKDIRNWAQKTQSKCHQMCIQFFAAKKHEKISARGSHD